MINPVAGVVIAGIEQAFGLLIESANAALVSLVLEPLKISPSIMPVLWWSRDLAVGTWGGALVLAAFGAMWPALVHFQNRGPWSSLLIRAGATALLTSIVPWLVATLLQLNAAVVLLLRPGQNLIPHWGGAEAAMSPLLGLLLLAVTLALALYLGILYGLRAIQIWWLAALLPWLAVAWMVGGNDARFGEQFRELILLVFMQAAQALVWWLTVRILVASSRPSTLLIVAGGLWLMARMPQELRRLVGAGKVGRLAW